MENNTMSTFNYMNMSIKMKHIENDHVSNSWRNGVFYEMKLLEKIKSLNLDGVYVDCGAHHGNHSIYFNKFCNSEKVISIEGNPFNYNYLKDNIINNNCSNTLYNIIISDKCGDTLQMEYDLENTGSSTVINSSNTSIEKKYIQNTTTTLNNLLKNEDKISIIKLDIENYEYPALLGAKEIIDKFHPVIVIELHKTNPYYNEIINFLEQNNYTTDNINYAYSPTYIYENTNSCNKIIHRETKLLGEPANILRLEYIEEVLNKLNLPPKTKILDFGGNNFIEYCQKRQFIYEFIDLETPQTNGTGGYFGGGLTYDGINIPFGNNSYDVIIVSFVLHHTSSNCIHLLKQLKNITRKYLIICEDLCSIEHPLSWHIRCFNHQNEGIFRSDEEWKFIFEALNLKLLDGLNIRCDRDKEFSDPYKHIYRIQYLLEKNESRTPYQPINIPVYISLTSIFQNQEILLQTLQSITSQTTTPDKIFLYLSEEPYLLDAGFENKIITNNQLLTFIKTNNTIIEINWVKNTGSYRKLLPLLKEKWNEDCIIITIDDDTIYSDNLITNLINDYDKHQCVIGYRGFTPKFDKFEDFDYNQRNELQNYSLYNFVTGKGSILYKPQFFHQTNNLIFNENIYLNTCAKQDDIWFYIIRIMNNISCYIRDVDWLKEDITSYGLYSHFNAYNNNNTKAFQNTLHILNI